MDITGNRDPDNTRIDKRILKHLLHETADLLEESQTHALMEKPSATTAHLLAQANWRMTATCAWALSELHPSPGEWGQVERLHAPAPIFSREEGTVSEQLASFVARVDRLHERACKLDDLSRGPMVSSADMRATAETMETATPLREAAPVIPLFGSGVEESIAHNSIREAHESLNFLMVARD